MTNDSLIGQTLADRYRILSVLGEGGMGRVYLAEHVTMHRKSAVKVMSPNLALASDAISRFHREAANASQINHQNVAQIYDFGETADGLLYLAMEFIEGQTLRHLIERNGPIPQQRAAELTRQIASALSAAHHFGIVHRDLKPDNIMIAQHHDGSDWVKVVDFGIAKTVQGSGGTGSQTVTTAGVSLGTPEYMSPEQLAGERLDNRTDLYSLGLVLFNMLTAELPYPRVTSRETLARRLTSRPLRLRDVVRTDWSPALQQALDRALDPDPTERYASVAEFANDVMLATADADAEGGTLRVVAVPSGRIAVAPASAALAPVPAWRAPAPSPPRERNTRRSSMLIAGTLIAALGLGGGAFVAMRSIGSPSPAATSDVPQQPSAAIVPGDTAVVVAPKQLANDHVASRARVSASESSPGEREKARSAAAFAAKQTDKSSALVSSSTVDAKAAAPATSPPAEPVSIPAAQPIRTDTMPAASDTARIHLIAANIEGHMRRAMTFIRQGDVQKARVEYREAAPVLGVLRQLYANSPEEQRMEVLLRAGEFQTMQACREATRDPTTRATMPENFRCESLIPPGMRPAKVRGRPRY